MHFLSLAFCLPEKAKYASDNNEHYIMPFWNDPIFLLWNAYLLFIPSFETLKYVLKLFEASLTLFKEKNMRLGEVNMFSWFLRGLWFPSLEYIESRLRVIICRVKWRLWREIRRLPKWQIFIILWSQDSPFSLLYSFWIPPSLKDILSSEICD